LCVKCHFAKVRLRLVIDGSPQGVTREPA